MHYPIISREVLTLTSRDTLGWSKILSMPSMITKENLLKDKYGLHLMLHLVLRIKSHFNSRVKHGIILTTLWESFIGINSRLVELGIVEY